MVSEDNLILALEFLTEGARAAVPRSLSRDEFQVESFQAETQRIHEKARDWTQGYGVQGLGIGEKLSGGHGTGELAMRVYVEKKKAEAKIKHQVPKTVKIPEIPDVPTDVVEIGRVELESFSDRVRPAMPGSGVGHLDVSVGTFGCLVRKRGTDDGLYILGNSHVLADSGLASPGDPILQPAKADGGNKTADTIAHLSEFVPFDFSPTGFPNLVDAAIAKVAEEGSVNPEIRILGKRPIGVSTALQRGMRVRKVGRTSDYSISEITDLHYRLRMSYKYYPDGRRMRAGLGDQVLCTRYTAGGDSGSLVLNDRHRAVGLHFAGSYSSSIFNRIRNVLDLLNVELVV
ncbi:MAG: hypothetical protein GY719_41030 [bacterium]|nr:hypothetical protein [bacterium]